MSQLSSIVSLSQVKSLVKQVGAFQLKHFRSTEAITVEKAMNELVSFVDETSEQLLFKGLTEIYPDAAFWGEEGGQRGEADWTWLVDPLDGTTNYLNGLDQFSISVALMYKGVTQFGVVYRPANDELFHAFRGEGFYHNGDLVSNDFSKLSLPSTLMGTGFPYRSPDLHESFFKASADLMTQCRGFRRLASAALDLCYLSCGWLQGFWESELQPYDVGAGLLFLEEAGLKATNHLGEPFDLLSDRVFVAAPMEIHEELQIIIQRAYGSGDLKYS
jgi:myo-inositol-1(or 4)-monophosphatase